MLPLITKAHIQKGQPGTEDVTGVKSCNCACPPINAVTVAIALGNEYVWQADAVGKPKDANVMGLANQDSMWERIVNLAR